MKRTSLLATIVVFAAIAAFPPDASAYYHAQMGRFINRDPIGYRAGDANVYRYVRNNPAISVDPSGRKEYDASGGYFSGGPYLGYMSDGDTVINTGVGTISVLSGNLEGNGLQGDRDYIKGRCALGRLGFSLPWTENGVYWAEWRGNDPGYTVMWTGYAWDDLNYSFLKQ